MRPVAGVLLLIGVANAAAGEAGPAAEEVLAGLPEGLVQRLEERRSVVLQEVRAEAGSPDPYLLAFVIFGQPPARTFELLAQTGRQGEYRSEVRSIETLERSPDGSLDEHRLRMLFVSVVYRLRYTLEPEVARISWALDPDFANDLRRVEGFWQLYPLDDGRTLGRMGTRVDVGPLVPAFLQDLITRKNLPETIESCRRWVDAGGSPP